jgi:hypothetical protein
MTSERKRWLAKMVDRKAHAIVSGQTAANSLYTSLADTHFTDEDLDFIIDRACRLGRGEHVE